MTNRPTLTFESDPARAISGCVSVLDLAPDLIACLVGCPEQSHLLRSTLGVRVVESDALGGEDLPEILGRREVLEGRLRFTPHFPFESGVLYRATFDPRRLGRRELPEVLTLEFSVPKATSLQRTFVRHVYPSGDSLPENLLRFYACFSKPMQRGWAQECIALLGPDGRPAPDMLYRPPVELWDRSMTCLTILLDPGRLKRGVGPNRALGPPLKVGELYTLAIGARMIDSDGRLLREPVLKAFCVTEAIREPIAIEQWKIRSPARNSSQPFELMFPRSLDWALLQHSIAIESEDGHSVNGRVLIDPSERQWSFIPRSPWAAGCYYARVTSDLEDVCGNNLRGAFDRPLQSASDLAGEESPSSIRFHANDQPISENWRTLGTQAC
jgi:hypothetical protein